MRNEMSHRERVSLALAHKQTDRVPIAMVCSGISPAARKSLTLPVEQRRGTTLEDYLAPLISISASTSTVPR